MIWILLLPILLLAVLLVLPIRLEVDTENNIYRGSVWGLGAFWVEPGEDRWHGYFKLFFWRQEVDWNKKQTLPPKKPKAIPEKRKLPFSIRQMRALFRNLLRAIKLQKLFVDWDTGDFVLNAWLYPAFRMASSGQRQLNINFFGTQILQLRLQTRLGALALAVLKVFINPKHK